MHFLVDAQLPPALARWRGDQGHEAHHVADLGLETASDREIWIRAEASNAVIITKDEDFARRRASAVVGLPVIWLRIGNTRREALLRWYAVAFPRVLGALEAGETLVEVR